MNDLPLRFFIALAMSCLIGLERETSGMKQGRRVALGVRTYSIVGMLGFGCAWLQSAGNPWALPTGMLGVTTLAVMGYIAKMKDGRMGWTSEVAVLLTYVVGALSLMGVLWAPMALGVVGAFLLSEKADIEQYVMRLDQAEFLAVLKFLLVTLVILQALPNTPYTDFQINPRKVWWIVVLVSTVGFIGYFLQKKFGSKHGLWLSGILGGMVSSTAVSIAVGRIAQRAPERGSNALQASLFASCVMYFRVLALIWFIRKDYAQQLLWPMLLLALPGLIMAFLVKPSVENPVGRETVPAAQNPFEVRPALLFATLFVALSAATVLVRTYYGNAGLLSLAAFMGVTDIDPFILSLAQQPGTLEKLNIAAILLAILSNTLVKGVYFGSLVKDERRAAFTRYGIWAALHVPFVLLAAS
ncbi:TPA: hypothetical protein DDW35_01855 [Candidatus Sumerlaeota bacterium]|nr:hypothetical protein [Candidatus Sumerlaeota bacterium]